MAHNPAEVLAAVLDSMEDGMAVLDAEASVLYWNVAAVSISGYPSSEMLSRPLPEKAYEIDATHLDALRSRETAAREAESSRSERPLLVHIRHRQGHSLPAMLHRTPLRDSLGKRFGTLLRFHPAEEIDTLPHGAVDGCDGKMLQHLEESQAALEDRLDEAMQEWHSNNIPFGVLWIMVDQATTLRKTHGRDACEAMLRIVEHSLLHGLRPTEMLGRWGNDEYLVLSHERTAEMLDVHAKHLAALVRSADFRWWGDRVPLTVSVGAAQAEQDQKLACILKRSQNASQTSLNAGGNQVTKAMGKDSAGGQECSQS